MEKEIMTAAQWKSLIRQGRVSDDKIRDLINTGRLSKEELVDEYVLSHQQIKALFFVSPEKHQENIDMGRYSVDDIRKFVRQGELDATVLKNFLMNRIRSGAASDTEIKYYVEHREVDSGELIHQNILTRHRLDAILGVPHEPIDVDLALWDDVPPLIPERVDVFVLGIVGSGKSTFMAGLMYYAHQAGLLSLQIENNKGYVYANTLINAVRLRLLPPATPGTTLQHMAANFRSPVGQIPMTFIEMSGEIFQKCFGRRVSDMPSNFVEYMSHENTKVVLMAVDYRAHGTMDAKSVMQATQFDFMLRFMEQHGTLNHTKAIAILITKWDTSPDQSAEAAIRFLREEYLNLFNLCSEMADKYRLRFEVFRFSLGTFDERKSYAYQPEDSQVIFNWLCEFAPVQKQRKGKGFWDKLFG